MSSDHSSDQHVVDEKKAVEHPANVDAVDPTLEDKEKAAEVSQEDTAVWSFRKIAAIISLIGVYIGSQIPLYFIGGCLGYVAKDIGGTEGEAWLPVANTLAIAGLAPFCGYLEDIFGRRLITLIGCLLLIVGCILVGTAHSFGQGVAGMAVAGAGAAIGELSSIAGIGELVPVSKRGLFVGIMCLSIIPFCPYVMYAQLLSIHSTWRWVIWISLIWIGIATAGIAAFYFPKKERSETPGQLLRQIDYLGAALSITGITLFLVALQAGGYTHPWNSANVLAPLVIGLVLIICFVMWEWKFAPNPMVPREIFAGQRIVATAFIIALIAGMFFYSVLNFYPLSFSTVFNPDPVQVGLKGLGYGFSTTFGAVAINWLLTFLRGHNRLLLVFSAILMTAFCGGLAAVTPNTPGLAVALGTIGSFGIGGMIVPPATIAMCVVPDHLLATTVALSLSIRVIGGSIGYTIYYAIFNHKLTEVLPNLVGGAAAQAGLPLSSLKLFVETFLLAPQTLAKVPGVTPAVIAAATFATREAFAQALRWVWYASIPFGVLTIVASASMPDIRPYLTNRVATTIAH